MSEPNASTPPRILLVDCDMFYVQVARLEDPEGAGREALLIVGGSPTGRGVVTSASYEAREYGVRSAMPTGQALRLCPDAVVVPVSRKACTDRSRDVRGVLAELAPVLQAASIDEFYLDFSGTERMLPGESLERTARRVREAVLDRTKISVSVGGGTRRIIAKLATNLAKPGGVHVVPPGDEAEFMRRFDLGDIPGIGPAFLATLKRRGLQSVDDVLGVQDEWLERWFGAPRASWLHRRVRGVDGSVVLSGEERKSISSERTFSRDLALDSELEASLSRQVSSVARSVRRQGFRARTITVKLRDSDFTTRQSSRTMPDPVESDHAIYEVARELLTQLRARRRTPARLLGVAASGLVNREEPAQLGLFPGLEAGEQERDRRVSRVMDDVKDRFGDDAIGSARSLRP